MYTNANPDKLEYYPDAPEELKHRPICECDHKLNNTGGVFLQSVGYIMCAMCSGIQKIRKPVN